MAPSTPSAQKFQQWSFDIINSPFGKRPNPPGSFDDRPKTPSSSMIYINSQLQAHGFSRKPIELASLPINEQETLVKCFFSILQQRADDLSMFETLSAAHRTLSYDHERLIKMHKQLAEESARAEGKEQHAKSLMGAAQQALKDEQAAHKQTREDAQKARTALAFVRSQAQHDLKKREAEIGRTMERWQKLTNDQSKLMASRSGLTCLNASDRNGSIRVSESSNYFQQTMEEMDDTRSRLIAENDSFRRVILKIAVNVKSALIDLSPSTPRPDHDRINPTTFFESTEPTACTAVTSHAFAAQSKISHLLLDLRDLVEVVKREGIELAKNGSAERQVDMEKVRGLEEELVSIKAQLDERQAFLEDFVERSNAALVAASASASANVKADTEGLGEDEAEGLESVQQQLASQKKALEEERKKFTEAAVRLGQERAEIELERIAFLEEKRALKLDEMLADLPPTPPQPDVFSKPRTNLPSSPSRTRSSSPRKPKHLLSPKPSHHSLARRAVLSSVYSTVPTVSSPLSQGKGKAKAVGGFSSDASAKERARSVSAGLKVGSAADRRRLPRSSGPMGSPAKSRLGRTENSSRVQKREEWGEEL